MPRVRLPGTDETALLEDEVARLIRERRDGLIEVAGPPGSGRSTAVSHLAYVLPAGDRVEYRARREDLPPGHAPPPPGRLVVFAGVPPYRQEETRDRLELAPWGRDQFTEYLRSRRVTRIVEVLSRVPGSRDPFDGLPEVWTALLDRLAAAPGTLGPEEALRLTLMERLGAGRPFRDLRALCLNGLAEPARLAEEVRTTLLRRGVGEGLRRLLRHPPVWRFLAAEEAHGVLEEGRIPPVLPAALGPELARRIGPRSVSLHRLEGLLAGPRDPRQAVAAEILHQKDFTAVARVLSRRAAEDGDPTLLSRASFAGARWAKATLRGVDLIGADLSGADLSESRLEAVSFYGSVLAAARFEGARLSSCSFLEADLAGADFTDAVLEDSRFDHQEIDCSCFRGARLPGCSFFGADLSGFRGPRGDFSGADLTKADLSDSVLPGANLERATLRSARLAGIRWAGADLRHADLTGAEFPTGSTREGLLVGAPASEGTRTGFYSEDLGSPDPAGIRKADLRKVDLRGADLTGTDLYLVDLREARLDPDAREHAVRCGAIL